jgi:hypothetical protein
MTSSFNFGVDFRRKPGKKPPVKYTERLYTPVFIASTTRAQLFMHEDGKELGSGAAKNIQSA